MQFDIRSNVRDVSRWLDGAHKRQVPFATVYAMTLTARDVKAREIEVMRRVFDRPTPYALNALQVTPATRTSMAASVEFKSGFGGGTPANRFLNPQVHGGGRSQKSHERQISPLLRGYGYLVPGRSASLNGYGNIAGGTLRKVISHLRVSVNADANASKSARSRRKRKAQAFFVSPSGRMVMERRGKDVRPFLVAVRAPVYRKRFPFYETASAVVRDRFEANFAIAFERSVATSNYKGRRGFR